MLEPFGIGWFGWQSTGVGVLSGGAVAVGVLTSPPVAHPLGWM